MERKRKTRLQILSGNGEKASKCCCFMELNMPGGTGPRCTSSLVHLQTFRKMLAQLTGSMKALPADKCKAVCLS